MNKILSILLVLSFISISVSAQTLKDVRDGKNYKTVVIGGQTWMAENVNFDTPGSWCYNNDKSNCDVYGRLYTWESALNACPQGFRMPNDNDWNNLIATQGTKHSAGGYLKDGATGLWNNPNTGATNESGFTALPGGRRLNDGTFSGVGTVASFWSQTEGAAMAAWGRHLMHDAANLNSFNSPEFSAYSLRCVKE